MVKAFKVVSLHHEDRGESVVTTLIFQCLITLFDQPSLVGNTVLFSTQLKANYRSTTAFLYCAPATSYMQTEGRWRQHTDIYHPIPREPGYYDVQGMHRIHRDNIKYYLDTYAGHS